MDLLLRVLIVVLLIGMFLGNPGFGWHSYGYWPSGVIGLLAFLLILKVLGVF